MYCPKCAMENVDEAKFCRACGANLSLVPQALTGRLPAFSESAIGFDAEGKPYDKRRRRSQSEDPKLDKGITKVFMGVGWIFVALAISFFGAQIAGHIWWFWLLIPAFGQLGSGVAEIVRFKQNQSVSRASLPGSDSPRTLQPPPPPPSFQRASELPSPDTSEFLLSTLSQPPSVTENTTRHLATPPRASIEKPTENTEYSKVTRDE